MIGLRVLEIHLKCTYNKSFSFSNSRVSLLHPTEIKRASGRHVWVGRGARGDHRPRHHERAGGALHPSAAGPWNGEGPARSGGHEEPMVLLPGPRDGMWVLEGESACRIVLEKLVALPEVTIRSGSAWKVLLSVQMIAARSKNDASFRDGH